MHPDSPGESDMEHRQDLRHDPARRRAVARASRSTSPRSWRSPSSSRASVSTSSRPASRSRRRATSSRSRRSPKSVRGPIDRRRCRAPAFKDVDRAWEAVRHADQAPHPRLHRDVEDPHGEEAPDDAGAGEGRGRGGGRPGPQLHRRRRVLARGRLPLRSRLHVRGLPDRGRQRRDDAQHPRHGRLRGARGLRQAHPRT